jgi:hypothetical protein
MHNGRVRVRARVTIRGLRLEGYGQRVSGRGLEGQGYRNRVGASGYLTQRPLALLRRLPESTYRNHENHGEGEREGTTERETGHSQLQGNCSDRGAKPSLSTLDSVTELRSAWLRNLK